MIVRSKKSNTKLGSSRGSTDKPAANPNGTLTLSPMQESVSTSSLNKNKNSNIQTRADKESIKAEVIRGSGVSAADRQAIQAAADSAELMKGITKLADDPNKLLSNLTGIDSNKLKSLIEWMTDKSNASLLFKELEKIHAYWSKAEFKVAVPHAVVKVFPAAQLYSDVTVSLSTAAVKVGILETIADAFIKSISFRADVIKAYYKELSPEVEAAVRAELSMIEKDLLTVYGGDTTGWHYPEQYINSEASEVRHVLDLGKYKPLSELLGVQVSVDAQWKGFPKDLSTLASDSGEVDKVVVYELAWSYPRLLEQYIPYANWLSGVGNSYRIDRQNSEVYQKYLDGGGTLDGLSNFKLLLGVTNLANMPEDFKKKIHSRQCVDFQPPDELKLPLFGMTTAIKNASSSLADANYSKAADDAHASKMSTLGKLGFIPVVGPIVAPIAMAIETIWPTKPNKVEMLQLTDQLYNALKSEDIFYTLYQRYRLLQMTLPEFRMNDQFTNEVNNYVLSHVGPWWVSEVAGKFKYENLSGCPATVLLMRDLVQEAEDLDQFSAADSEYGYSSQLTSSAILRHVIYRMYTDYYKVKVPTHLKLVLNTKLDSKDVPIWGGGYENSVGSGPGYVSNPGKWLPLEFILYPNNSNAPKSVFSGLLQDLAYTKIQLDQASNFRKELLTKHKLPTVLTDAIDKQVSYEVAAGESKSVAILALKKANILKATAEHAEKLASDHTISTQKKLELDALVEELLTEYAIAVGEGDIKLANEIQAKLTQLKEARTNIALTRYGRTAGVLSDNRTGTSRKYEVDNRADSGNELANVVLDGKTEDVVIPITDDTGNPVANENGEPAVVVITVTPSTEAKKDATDAKKIAEEAKSVANEAKDKLDTSTLTTVENNEQTGANLITPGQAGAGHSMVPKVPKVPQQGPNEQDKKFPWLWIVAGGAAVAGAPVAAAVIGAAAIMKAVKEKT